MSATPNFTGRQVLVLHRPGETTDRLGRHLAVLGLRVTVQWMPLGRDAPTPDLVLVDADEGWSELLPWAPAENPAPLIALLGSEAPGRIAWALDQGAQAIIAKPVTASAVYPALVMATRFHAQSSQISQHILELEERVRLRPLVLGAVQAIMAQQRCSEAAAYRSIRQEAMRSRLALEQVAASILGRAGSRSAAG